MYRATLVTAAAALALAATAVSAQQQKGPDAGPQMQQKGPDTGAPTQSRQPGQQQEGQQGPGPQGAEKAEPKGKATKGAQSEPKEKAPGKSAEPKAQKGTAEKGRDPGDKDAKGTAQKSQQPDKSGKGTAEKAQPQDKSRKGTAEKQPQDKSTKGAEKAEPKDKATKGASKKDSGERVQLSQEQRTNVSQTLLKDRRVNRVTRVNFTINVGVRVPRTVTLVALPASVIQIVPTYRSYRYFVVDERICIVDPATYEIVEIIEVSDRTASGPRGGATLVLTEEERAIILAEIDMSGGSTLALGALSEGSDVPRDIRLRTFSGEIVEKVPKVRGHKFFTAENRIAIVDEQGTKVQLVIGKQR